MEELYKDFLKSLEAKAYNPIMIHKPSDVTMAKKFLEIILLKKSCVKDNIMEDFGILVFACKFTFSIYC